MSDSEYFMKTTRPQQASLPIINRQTSRSAVLSLSQPIIDQLTFGNQPTPLRNPLLDPGDFVPNPQTSEDMDRQYHAAKEIVDYLIENQDKLIAKNRIVDPKNNETHILFDLSGLPIMLTVVPKTGMSGEPRRYFYILVGEGIKEITLREAIPTGANVESFPRMRIEECRREVYSTIKQFADTHRVLSQNPSYDKNREGDRTYELPQRMIDFVINTMLPLSDGLSG